MGGKRNRAERKGGCIKNARASRRGAVPDNIPAPAFLCRAAMQSSSVSLKQGRFLSMFLKPC